MIAALYARVSTQDQKCDLQLTELREFSKRFGWEIAEYVDQGVSGSKRNRPALDRLMKDAQQKKVDVVLVWKLDRFGRSLQHMVENVQILDRAGIRFIAVTQSIDTDQKSAMGKFILHLFAALAEFERDLTIERVKAGVAEAKRQGKHCGRPARVFRRDQVVKMRSEGRSWRDIAWELKLPLTTVRESVRKVSSPEL